jgi:hypothetical protein
MLTSSVTSWVANVSEGEERKEGERMDRTHHTSATKSD